MHRSTATPGSSRDIDYLAQYTITAKAQEIALTIPHPARFALHKLVVLDRRPSPEKQAKDKETATRLLRALIDERQMGVIKDAFVAMPRRWRSKVRQQLTDPLDATMLNIVTE